MRPNAERRIGIKSNALSESAMTNRYVDGEPAAELLERRWFAALRAARSVQADCEVLLGVLRTLGGEPVNGSPN
jgi:hypothetical protein